MLSLRAYLDSGAPLDLVPELGRLAEAVVIDRREHSADWLFHAARDCRRLASSLLSDPLHEDLARVLEWAAEAYEDEEVARRFEEALPREVLGEILASAEEPRHPHRLVVVQAASFSCSACSDEYVESLGISVQALDGITYCRHCIRIAAGAVSDIGAVPGDAGEHVLSAAKESGSPRRRLRTIAAMTLVAAFLTSGAGVASGRLTEPLEDVIERTLERFGFHNSPRSKSSGCPRHGVATGTRCPNVDRQSAGAQRDQHRQGHFNDTSRDDGDHRAGYDGEYHTGAGVTPKASQNGQTAAAEVDAATSGAGSPEAAPVHVGETVEQQPQQQRGDRRTTGVGVAPPAASPPKSDIPTSRPPTQEPSAPSPVPPPVPSPSATEVSGQLGTPTIPTSPAPEVPNQSPPTYVDPPSSPKPSPEPMPEATPEPGTTPALGTADERVALALVNP